MIRIRGQAYNFVIFKKCYKQRMFLCWMKTSYLNYSKVIKLYACPQGFLTYAAIRI
jgi:hypothetical protein